MPIEDDLLNEVTNVFGQAVMTSHTSQSDASDLYELYVFSLVIEAAAEEGATFEFRDVHGNIPQSLVFRTSPGEISSRKHPYTHAVIQFPNKLALECHIGIYVGGKSDVRHECDVAVLYQTEAQTCRQNPGVLPRHHKVLLATECKFYTGNVKLNLARAFLGLVADIPGRHGERYFIMNTPTESVAKLLMHHKRKVGHDVVPNQLGEVTKLKSSFREVFDSFKIRG
jgi:hypothetical protein